jgi:hypothetical protein
LTTKLLYDAGAPASSLTELLDYLDRDQSERFLYRGQVRDYGNLVPSFFRAQRGEEINGFVPVGEHGVARLEEVDAAKFSVIKVLIKEYGKELGNYIAQQYLCRSEVLDCTASLHVAAFFATREHPYDVAMRDLAKAGVIYRFDRHLIDGELRGALGPGWRSRVGQRRGDAEGIDHRIYVEREQQQGWRPDDLYWTPRELETIKPSLIEAEFLTRPSSFAYCDIETLAVPDDDGSRRAGFIRGLRGETYPCEGARASAQDGGFIVPRYVWKCLVPEPSTYATRGRFNPEGHRPRIAWGEYMVGLEDPSRWPATQAFYFTHTGETPDVDPSVFWPEILDDKTFHYLWMLARLGHEIGLGGKRGVAPELLVDIGFPLNLPQLIG